VLSRHKAYWSPIFATLLMAMIACADDTTSTSSLPVRAPTARLAAGLSLPPTSPAVTIDNLFARVDSLVPGFGGYWVDESGRPRAWLVDTSSASILGAALRSVFPANSSIADGLIVSKGTHRWTDLVSWYYSLGSLGIDPADVARSENSDHIVSGNSGHIESSRVPVAPN